MRESRGSEMPAAGERSEAGFALVLALLSLMLLTFLGLTLATSTSTELRIATNYRWQQQALYNAEAGIEAGRRILRSVTFVSVLPTAPTTRTVAANGWDGTSVASDKAGATYSLNRNDQWGNATRNWEGGPCDKRGNGVGYGVVLDDNTAAAPYQYKTTLFGQSLGGAFTLWVRRPVIAQNNGKFTDYSADNDHIILVSEGIAPYTGAALASTTAASNAAVQVVEVLLSRVQGSSTAPCATRTGQSGQGPEGAGFSACDAITGAGLAPALGAAGTGGRGTYADTAVK
jgi:hypothetical protein